MLALDEALAVDGVEAFAVEALLDDDSVFFGADDPLSPDDVDDVDVDVDVDVEPGVLGLDELDEPDDDA